MNRNPTPDRPTTDDSTDGRKRNAGRGDGLGAAVQHAVATAPPDAETIEVAAVAWRSYEQQRDPAEVWSEVSR